MDLSSEMIHSLLPVFLVTGLGASTLALGLIEGIAEGAASISKVFSGTLSDRFARRKPFVVFGYGLAALSKPLFPLADSAAWVFGARFADRIGKGIRGAPRDALLGDATPVGIRGAAYGLRQALDTAGALLGPLVALGLMQVLRDDIRIVFWVATLPALLAVVVLVGGVSEPPRRVDERARSVVPGWRDLTALGSAFWVVVGIGGVFSLARFSEGFLVLRAHERGLALDSTPLALAVLNATYVISAYPAGRISDRIGRKQLLMLGLATLVVSDCMLAFAAGAIVVLVGVALWGLHLGLTQGILAAMVADTAPPAYRGAAFGVFHFVSGITTIAASVLAGALWQWLGPAFTFLTGATLAATALAGLLGWPTRGERSSGPSSR